ncbi:transposase [Colletotrichum incanum]|uniref:Transposase n=1 Tax=Colletotrichum incanum TaxID=1573173 RepID=A0A167BF59_COLIC|nr:transposase [Colletotrichum incanum]
MSTDWFSRLPLIIVLKSGSLIFHYGLFTYQKTSNNRIANPLSLQQMCQEALNVTRPPDANHQNIPNVPDQEAQKKYMHHPQHAHSHVRHAMSPLTQPPQQSQMLSAGEHVRYPITQAYTHDNNTARPYFRSPNHYPTTPPSQQIVPSQVIMPHNYNPEIALPHYQALIAQLCTHNPAALHHHQAGPSPREQKRTFSQFSDSHQRDPDQILQGSNLSANVLEEQPYKTYDEPSSQRHSPPELENAAEPTHTFRIRSPSTGDTTISCPSSDSHKSSKSLKGKERSKSNMQWFSKGAQTGIPMTKAARSRRMTRASQERSKGSIRSNINRRRFTLKEEKSIVKWVTGQQELNLTPSSQEVVKFARRALDRKGDHGRLGNSWFSFFQNRHPSVDAVCQDDETFDESALKEDDDAQEEFTS